MPVEPEDPRLTALLLGELSSSEQAAVEAQAAATPKLADSLSGLQQTADALHRELAAEPCPRLTAGQREMVLREIASHSATGGTASSGAWGAWLASWGWGSWGAWLALAGLTLVVTVGLTAWVVGSHGRRPTVATVRQGDDTTAREHVVGRRPTASGTAATAEPPLIVIRVGDSLPLRVLGRVGSGRERNLSPDRLQWSLDPPTGYVDFDPRTLTLRGLSATAQPVRLTVRLDQLKAEVRIRVIDARRGT